MRKAMTIRVATAVFLLTSLLLPAGVFSEDTKGKKKIAGRGQLVAKARGKKDRVEVKDPSVCRLILIYGKQGNAALETAWTAAHSFSVRNGARCIKVFWGKEKEGGLVPNFLGGDQCPYCKEGDFKLLETKIRHEELRRALEERKAAFQTDRAAKGNRRKRAQLTEAIQAIDGMLKRLSEAQVDDSRGGVRDYTKEVKTISGWREILEEIEKTLLTKFVPKKERKKLWKKMRERIERKRRSLACPNEECGRLRYGRKKAGQKKIKRMIHEDNKIKCFSQVLAIYHGEKKERTASVLQWLGSHIDAPINRLILWSCYGSRQINSRDLTGYFKRQKTLIRDSREKTPCACRCEPEVYTAEDLFLKDDSPRIVDAWIKAKKHDIAELNRQIAGGSNPKGLDGDAVVNWRFMIMKMRKVRNEWLIPRLAEAKKPGNEDLRRTKLSMPLGINRDSTRKFVLQSPTWHFRRYTADGSMEKNVKVDELFDGVPIEINPLLIPRGILAEYDRLDGKLVESDRASATDESAGDKRSETKKDRAAQAETEDKAVPQGELPYSGPSPEELKEMIQKEEGKRRLWEAKPQGREKTANLNLIESTLERLRKQLKEAEAAEKIDPVERIKALRARLEQLESKDKKTKTRKEKREEENINKTLERLENR